MEMPMPNNTLMMTGAGQFRPLEMGGMFTVVKAREGLAAGDYKDPVGTGTSEGTVAYEYAGPVSDAARQKRDVETTKPAIEMNVVKPDKGGHSGRH
jgi:hypothetical protein